MAAALLLVLVQFVCVAPLRAQEAIPSAEQLEILRNIPESQRDEILRQIGGIARTPAPAQDRDRRADRQPQDEQDARRTLQPTDDEEQERVPAVLKGDDVVVIKIDVRSVQPLENGIVLPPNTPPGTMPPVRTDTPTQLPPTPAPDIPADELVRLRAVVDLIRSRNPYRLSSEGILTLPGFSEIPLAGLTEFQATLRLQSEPALKNLSIGIIRLPLRKIGTEALKPFGYDLFDRRISTFAPVTDVPVPADYIVGPGDELLVQLYGNQNRSLPLVVGRDGRINFPTLGPINVGGQTFNRVKADIEARVEQQMIGVRASVTMGDTRSIRIFVLGEARYPGSYTVSGLGTITSALFAAGGVRPIGSLRNIQLRRQGALVRTLDLYDMLIRGDTSNDASLLPSDVVFIPPLEATISINGQVRRPAIYEVKPGATTVDAVELAGGLTAEADRSKASLTRIDATSHRSVLTIDLASSAARQPVLNGDSLQIPRIRPTLDSGVVVQGHVHAPASFAFREGMRLTDVIRSVDDLRPNADLGYVLIRRESPPDREVTAVSADLSAALREPGSPADIPLMSRDRITVFDREPGRERIIRPLLEELRLQSRFGNPTAIVTIDGRVKVPGEYPLEPGMKVADLIRAGGGLSDAAYGGTAELTRHRTANGDTKRTELVHVDLAALIRGEASANLGLEAFDNISIKELPAWGDQESVVLEGELLFPGRYAIKRGETLKSVIDRAGGVTSYAFAEGSVFTREELKSREQKQLDVLAKRLQNDLAILALQGAAANQTQAGTALSVGQSLLTQIRSSPAVGRLVIDLPRTLRARPGSAADIILRDGDRLIVPRFQQEVTVIGEVQTATSHLYRAELSRDDYVRLSGGMTRRADGDKTYIVRADGSVVAKENARWFSSAATDIRPGDTIVVPLDTERLPALPFWQAVTQIIYNLAISAAAVNSF